MERQLLTVKETAKVLGIAPGTIYNKLQRNTKMPFDLKPIRVGRSVRFKKKDIEKLIE